MMMLRITSIDTTIRTIGMTMIVTHDDRE
jgi:hypothetical protein